MREGGREVGAGVWRVGVRRQEERERERESSITKGTVEKLTSNVGYRNIAIQ